MVPITYEGEHGWHTVGRAITTRNTDEAKGWNKEMENYKKGITSREQAGYQYHVRESFPMTYNRIWIPKHKKRKTFIGTLSKNKNSHSRPSDFNT